MIRILNFTSEDSINLERELSQTSLKDICEIKIIELDEINDNNEWDDVLIVPHDGFASTFTKDTCAILSQYQNENEGRNMILPISYDKDSRVPPIPLSDIKSILHTEIDALVKRIQALIGFRLQKGDRRLFISYRASDGADIALQIDEFLKAQGYNTWRDEAKDKYDEQPFLQVGMVVQEEIETSINKAKMILLLDTPDAVSSYWIKEEVRIAIAEMIPILPVCFKINNNRKKGCSFSSVGATKRFFDIRFHRGITLLSAEQLNEILLEIEDYLSKIFVSKQKIPHKARLCFKNEGYDWNTKNQKLQIYDSKKSTGRINTRVLSHCSFYDEVYIPSINTFIDFYKVNRMYSQHKLFIYDGDLLLDQDIEKIVSHDLAFDDVTIIHHSELSRFINSNFMSI